MHKVAIRHRREDIKVAENQCAFRDDADGLVRPGGDFQALAGELELAFARLIRVGDARQGDGFGNSGVLSQEVAEEFRRVVLDDDLRLEAQARVIPQELVGGPRVAVRAAVFATTVRVQAEAEAHVRAVVLGDDGLGAAIRDELGGWVRAGCKFVNFVGFKYIESEDTSGLVEPGRRADD